MSIIDKQGKIFGKLNIIDLIAVILIVAVAAFLGHKLTSSTGDSLAGPGQPVVYTVEVENVEPEVYEFVAAEVAKGPCQLTASNEMVDGYVTRVEAVPVEESTVQPEENHYAGLTVLDVAEAGNYDLLFTIEGTLKDNLSSELGTQEIRVGKTHIVKTTTFELMGGVIPTTSAGWRRPGSIIWPVWAGPWRSWKRWGWSPR